ncbi:SDR family NAD(P)-dependent oxidoreductase [Castellaniella caeni]|uniref:SDR family NAD(P)-dependent oxidoreductase n=1 Tax=Castellaniella caeni TaxID=266123 RepID=UPI000A02664A|nr:SDR family NAD(P)-dependent oxidoreductase [Castellaniella caeni]
MNRQILITGATSAIGSALALQYAAPGACLILHGRKKDLLDQIASQCRALGAQVSSQQLDVRDTQALQAWLKNLPCLDLVIINAGMNTHIGPQGQAEPWDEVDALIDVNLKASMLIAQSVLPTMRERGRGQIAFMSSLAGYFGLPVTPAYSASKAGVKAYAEALRGWLAPEGIRVNVIMPGYVKSPMCDAMPGPKPWVWTPARAAATIRRGLDKDRPRISFPFPLNWGTWWLAVLPAAWSHRIVRWLGYGA